MYVAARTTGIPGAENRTTNVTPTMLKTIKVNPTSARDWVMVLRMRENTDFMAIPFRGHACLERPAASEVMHNQVRLGPVNSFLWHSRTMTDDWMLTLTDVADVLGCTRDDVLAAISEGHIRVMPGRKVRVSHRDLLEFVASTQRAALSLGSTPIFEPNLIASRPIESLNVNGANRR